MQGMIMFNYLTIEQAIKYVSSKVEYEFLFDNLKDLEAFQIINPVFFFKGFAKSIKGAVKKDPANNLIPSTKGVL